MSQENVEIVRGAYSEWQRGNMKAGVDRFDPEIAFESSCRMRASESSRTDLPKSRRSCVSFSANGAIYRMFGDHYREVGSTKVFVSGRQTAIGHDSGAVVEDTLFSIWTFRDGKVVHLIFERDRQRALGAAGLSE